MSELSAYTCTPRQAKSLIIECIEAGLVPALHSSPGMGKSSIMKAVAKEFGLFMIDHRLSTSAPEDLTGLPRFRADGFAEFAPFADLFPIVGAEIPEGYNGWLLFLDEWNAAPRTVQAACFKLIVGLRGSVIGVDPPLRRLVDGQRASTVTHWSITSPAHAYLSRD